MRARTWLAMTALLVALPAGVASAQGPGGGPGSWDRDRGPGPRARGGMDMEERLGRLAERLELSDEQLEKIKGIHQKGEAQRLDLHRQVLRLRNEIEGEMLKDSPNRGNVVRLTEQIGGVHTKLRVQRVEMMFAMREVLTPEQRTRFMGLHGMGLGERGPRHGRHGPRH